MSNEDEVTLQSQEKMQLTTEIISSYVSNNPIMVDELHNLIKSVHAVMVDLSNNVAAPVKQKPAVAISRSVTEDYIICLEDGAKLKMLKRYIRTRYNLTPDEYRQKWKLPSDYPMVAPAYSKRRSSLAKEIGLGTSKRRGKNKPKLKA